MQKNYHQQFYYSQNLDIRKQIRQYDFRLAQGEAVLSQCNFLVAGPPKVGKSSLLRTLQFALNGSQGWGLSKKSHHLTLQIKKGARYHVQGTKQLKQIAQKFGIQGIQLSSQEKACSRYKRAFDFVEGTFGHCIMQPSELQHRFKAKVCLILLNLSMDIPVDELAYLKYLKSDMNDRSVKVILVLTGRLNQRGEEQKDIQTRISALQSQFDLKRDDVICMETYQVADPSKHNGKLILKQSQVPSTKIDSSEEINFYALQLLQRILSESQKNNKGKTGKTRGWLCQWA